MASTLGAQNPLRYRGYVYDTETEYYYLQSRYYDPEIGRFINADAFVSTGQGFVGYNMFVYCGNNSVRYSDSTGHKYREGLPQFNYSEYTGEYGGLRSNFIYNANPTRLSFANLEYGTALHNNSVDYEWGCISSQVLAASISLFSPDGAIISGDVSLIDTTVYVGDTANASLAFLTAKAEISMSMSGLSIETRASVATISGEVEIYGCSIEAELHFISEGFEFSLSENKAVLGFSIFGIGFTLSIQLW